MGTARSRTRPLGITIDTREQQPLNFFGVKTAHPPVVTYAALPEGDYALTLPADTPVDQRIAIERKSLADLFGSMGQGRRRFEAEMERLEPYGHAVLLVEAPVEWVMCPNEHLRHATAMNPKTVILSMVAFAQRFGVHCWCCPGRAFAEQLAYRMLERWAEDHGQ